MNVTYRGIVYHLLTDLDVEIFIASIHACEFYIL